MTILSWAQSCVATTSTIPVMNEISRALAYIFRRGGWTLNHIFFWKKCFYPSVSCLFSSHTIFGRGEGEDCWKIIFYKINGLLTRVQHSTPVNPPPPPPLGRTSKKFSAKLTLASSSSFVPFCTNTYRTFYEFNSICHTLPFKHPQIDKWTITTKPLAPPLPKQLQRRDANTTCSPEQP